MPKRKPAKRHRLQTVHVAEEDQISTATFVTTKLKPWTSVAISIVAISSAFAAFIGAWNWFGGPWPVSDHRMADAINKVETKLTDAIHGSDQKYFALQSTMLDVQSRTLFLQKTQLQSNLAGIEAQLREHPGDQFLTQRKNEVGNILEFVNRESANVQERLQRARNGG